MSPLLDRCGRVLRRVADAILPQACAVCGVAVSDSGPPLCALCELRVPRIALPLCRRCGATRTRTITAEGRFGSAECPECGEWPRELRGAAAPFRYDGAAVSIVQGLKYRGWTALAAFMGKAMVPAARRLARTRHPLLVPVPLSPARRRQRGFNQACLLAEALGEQTGWPVADILNRRRAGPSQASLGRHARERRVRDLYGLRLGVSAGLAGGSPEGEHRLFLLVDDVVTTGATAAACAAALAGGGLECAGVVSFARTLPRPEQPARHREQPAGVV